MAKSDEKQYFQAIGDEGINFTLQKPFSDSVNLGSLLSDIAAVFSLLPKLPSKIIDLGCGSGWTSNFLALAGYQVTGVDISKEAIRAAQQSFKLANPRLEFICGDYDSLDFRNEFDAAVFFDSLHHSDDEVVALEAAFEALKPGGLIILCEPGRGHSKSQTSIEAVKKYGVSERDMPPRLSKKALRQAGFKHIKTYAYPAIVHRVNYKTFYGNKSCINLAIFRGAISFALNTFLKSDHGIVVAQKQD